MFQHLDLIRYRAYADLRAEASRLYVSYLWWIIEPIIEMLVYYVVFSQLLDRGGPAYVPFLLTGLALWKWFSSTIMVASGSIQRSHVLLSQVRLPVSIFPLISILTSSVKFLVLFLILIVFLLSQGYGATGSYVALPLLFAAEFSLILFLSGLCAAAVAIVPDLQLILTRILLMGLFLSGIWYDGSDLPESMQPYFYWNPMATIIDGMRKVLLENEIPPLGSLVCITALSFIGFLVVTWTLNKYDRKILKWTH